VVLFCHITSKVDGEKYPNLLDEIGGSGFPHIAALDAEGAVIAKLSGGRTVAGFKATIAHGKVYVDTKKKADAGDKIAKIDLVILDVEMETLSMDDGKAKFKDLGELSKAQQDRWTALEVADEVMGILKGTQPTEEAKIESGKKFNEMRGKGSVPSAAREQAFGGFWSLILTYGEDAKDVEAFEAGLKILKDKYGDNPNAKKFFDEKEEALKKMKEETK
jgi:hypothetical protein